jgi:hypothetical protein
MHFHGPDRADLANVFMLNSAFIAWLRAKPSEHAPERGLPPEIHARFAALSGEQRERLARVPFLLMSFAEDDEARWQSLFAEQRTRDLLQCVQQRDEVASRLIAAGLGFLWQLSHRNPYVARLVSGASLAWCEQLASCTLMELFSRALEDQALLTPRMAATPDLWHKLLTAGVSSRRHLRRAARVAALHTLLAQSPLRASRPLAAAACKLPAARTRRSGKRAG